MARISFFCFYSLLFLYAFFYRISSSEFWPITVSKSWFGVGGTLELSLLQKPLFSFILSTLHVFQIKDSSHVYLVKTVFSMFGLASIYFFSYFTSQLIKRHSQQEFSPHWLGLGLCLLSPVFLNNFFNIRTDQLAFLLLSMFFYFSINKKLYPSLACLILLLLSGLKEFPLALPALYFFYKQFNLKLSKKLLFYSLALLLGASVWVLGLNISVLEYIRESYRNNPFPNPQLSAFLLSEGFLLVIALAVVIYNFYKKQVLFWSVQSVFFLILLFINPQSYSFYIASLVPIIYVPLFIFIFKYWPSFRAKILLVTTVLFCVHTGLSYQQKKALYESNQAQLKFIDLASDIVKKRRLLYLDGMGILPKQRFNRCFVSPDDVAANSNCIDQISTARADVIIMTRRLTFLNQPGTDLFNSVKMNYEQIYPNFWVRRDQLDDVMRKKIDLSPDLPLPILIF